MFEKYSMLNDMSSVQQFTYLNSPAFHIECCSWVPFY